MFYLLHRIVGSLYKPHREYLETQRKLVLGRFKITLELMKVQGQISGYSIKSDLYKDPEITLYLSNSEQSRKENIYTENGFKVAFIKETPTANQS